MDVSLPKDDALYSELVAPRYMFTSSGKIQVESKDSMKKRGVRSPDRADALCSSIGQRPHDDGIWRFVQRLVGQAAEAWDTRGGLGVLDLIDQQLAILDPLLEREVFEARVVDFELAQDFVVVVFSSFEV